MKKQVTSRNYQSHRNLEQTAFNTYGKKVVRRSPDQEQHYYSDLKSSGNCEAISSLLCLTKNIERNKTFDKRKDKGTNLSTLMLEIFYLEHNMSKGFDSKHSSMFK